MSWLRSTEQACMVMANKEYTEERRRETRAASHSADGERHSGCAVRPPSAARAAGCADASCGGMYFWALLR